MTTPRTFLPDMSVDWSAKGGLPGVEDALRKHIRHGIEEGVPMDRRLLGVHELLHKGDPVAAAQVLKCLAKDPVFGGKFDALADQLKTELPIDTLRAAVESVLDKVQDEVLDAPLDMESQVEGM